MYTRAQDMDFFSEAEISETQRIAVSFNDVVTRKEIFTPDTLLDAKERTGVKGTREDSKSCKPKKESTRRISFIHHKHIVDDYIKPVSEPKRLSNIEVSSSTISLSDVNTLFELEAKFSEGAQGELRFAFDKSLKRNIAVKSLKTLKSSDADAQAVKELFVSEARIMAQLDHPSIVPLYGLHGEEGDRFHLAMKFVKGKTLSEYLNEVRDIYKRQGAKFFDARRSLGIRLGYFLKMCEAVQYAHNNGVVHRDIKPDNIMIGDYGEVYVMDWGLAMLIDTIAPGSNIHEDGKVIISGTPGYIAPELIRGEVVDEKTDIYSLGIVLFEMVTLKQALTDKSVRKLMLKALKSDFAPCEHLFSGVHIPCDLKAIITKATCYPASDRYQTVDAFARDLKLFLMQEETSALPDNSFRKFFRWINNHRLTATSIFMSILLVFSAITIVGLIERNHEIAESKKNELALAAFQHRVDAKGHLIDRQFLHLTDLLGSIAHRAGLLLNMDNPFPNSDRVYTYKDYLSDSTAPSDLAHSAYYNKKISLKSPVFKMSPDVMENESGRSMNQILPLTSSFRDILLKSYTGFEAKTEDNVFRKIMEEGASLSWIYIGLANGVYASYPGKGGYSDDFDPRTRPWYKAAGQSGTVAWSQPYMCVTGIGAVISCSEAIHDTDNKFYGVLGMDISFSYIQEKIFKGDGGDTPKKYLLNNEGKIVISSDYNNLSNGSEVADGCDLILKPFSKQHLFEQASANQGGVFEVAGSDGDDVFVFSYVPSLKWFYVEQAKRTALKLH